MIHENSQERPQRLSIAKRIEELAATRSGMRRLALQAASLRSRIDSIEEGLQYDEHPDGGDLIALYAAMGAVLPEVVGKTFEQVKAFHRSVTSNRRIHLADDLDKLRERLSETMAEIDALEGLEVRLIEGMT